jgi:hypothetical protein
MPKLQNFSATRNNDEVISVLVDTDAPNQTLENATIQWAVYGMTFAVPDPTQQLIAKTTDTGAITVPPSPPMTFYINLNAVDTRDLDLGNYYHEGMVVDEVGNRVTVVYGAMALTLETI